jgi:hypothetical protein
MGVFMFEKYTNAQQVIDDLFTLADRIDDDYVANDLRRIAGLTAGFFMERSEKLKKIL